jgi:hypothetical protein
LDVVVNLADQRVVHLALTAPDGTSQHLQVDGDLGLTLKIWWFKERQRTIRMPRSHSISTCR